MDNQACLNCGEGHKHTACSMHVRSKPLLVKLCKTKEVKLKKIIVSEQPLRRVLEALSGPAHLIRELQATRGPLVGDDNPINLLVGEYNKQLSEPEMAFCPACEKEIPAVEYAAHTMLEHDA